MRGVLLLPRFLDLLARHLLARIPVVQEHLAHILHNLQLCANEYDARLDGTVVAVRLLVLVLPCARDIGVG